MSNCPFCGAEELVRDYYRIAWACWTTQIIVTGSVEAPRKSPACRVRELEAENERLREALLSEQCKSADNDARLRDLNSENCRLQKIVDGYNKPGECRYCGSRIFV